MAVIHGNALSTQDNSQIHNPEIAIIAKGAGIFFIGSIIGVGLRYIFELIVARNLGTDLFGLFILGLSILKIMEIISTLGLHRGVLRYIALFQGEGDKERIKGTIILAMKVVIVVGLIISLLTILLSKFVATNIFHKIDLTNVLKIFAVAIPFTALTTIFVFSTQSLKIMKYTVYVREIFEPAIRIIIVIIMFSIGWVLFGAIFAFIISLMLGTFLAFFYLKTLFPTIVNKKVKPFYEYRKIFNFSWPLLLADFFGFVVIWINILMIGYFKASHDVGVYSASHRTALLGGIILVSFNSIFSPIIADFYNRKKFKRLEQLFKIVTKWILSLSFPVCLLMIFYASEILSLFGENFVPGTTCLVILSIALLVNSVIGSSGIMIMMSGKSKINLLNNTLTAFLIISFNFLLIPKHGIVGAALSFLLSVILVSIIRLVETYLIFKLHPFRIDFFKPLLAGVISFSILKLLTKHLIKFENSMLLIISGSLIFSFIYVLIIYLLKVEDEDRIILQRIKTKLLIFK